MAPEAHPLILTFADALERTGYEFLGEQENGFWIYELYEPVYRSVAVPVGPYAELGELLRSMAEQGVNMAELIRELGL